MPSTLAELLAQGAEPKLSLGSQVLPAGALRDLSATVPEGWRKGYLTLGSDAPEAILVVALRTGDRHVNVGNRGSPLQLFRRLEVWAYHRMVPGEVITVTVSNMDPGSEHTVFGCVAAKPTGD